MIMIHMASVWVPFTSESKEAIADYDEIRKEMKLALMECGRKLGTYLRKRQKMQREAARRDVFERYIGEISKAINAIHNAGTRRSCTTPSWRGRKRTEFADAQLTRKAARSERTSRGVDERRGRRVVESRAGHLDPGEAPT